MPQTSTLEAPAMRSPCGHEADADYLRTSSCMVAFCARCQCAYDVGPAGAQQIRITLIVAG